MIYVGRDASAMLLCAIIDSSTAREDKLEDLGELANILMDIGVIPKRIDGRTTGKPRHNSIDDLEYVNCPAIRSQHRTFWRTRKA